MSEGGTVEGTKGGRNPSLLHCHTVSFIFNRIGKTASVSGMAAWVPEMPGCVDFKLAYLRNYSGIGRLRQN